jgi:hypothetical protein
MLVIWHFMVRLETCDITFGKGEVESSILSNSTIILAHPAATCAILQETVSAEK